MNIGQYYMPTRVLMSTGCVRQGADAWVLGKRALIVTGHASAQCSGALQDITQVLDERRVQYTVFDGISANPDVDQVYLGAAKGIECDFVIGIGGGSAMDAAKSIAWVIASKIRENDFFAKVQSGDAVLPIVAVPLTCGTGSEVTQYSIITDNKAKTKVNISSSDFFPRVALLDPRYLESLPAITMCDTALDALSHAIESALSPRMTMVSMMLAKESIRLVIPELVRLAHEVFVNREVLQRASMLAGIAIAQTGTGLVHAMGYPLTYYKQMPHGRANAILLAGYLDFMSRSTASIVREILEAASLDSVEELQALIDMLFETLQIERPEITDEEMCRFATEPLRLEVMRRYRAMPSPEDVMDIYRTGF